MMQLRIGTRGSALALRQAEMVSEALKKQTPDLRIEIVDILTSGDWKPEDGETRLSETKGGKGQFAKEIEQALLRGDIDCGVHSMKDMDSTLPKGLVIDHMLPREDARDAFLSNDYKDIFEMPSGASVGTSSVRRQAFILAKRPDLKIVPFRGNVPTRIEKLRSWKVDATILACAGLNRLNLTHEIASILTEDDMLPAAGQGAIGVETRVHDIKTRRFFDAICCRKTELCVKAERAALAALDGSCYAPIGAYATLSKTTMYLRVIVGRLDGQQQYKESATVEIVVPEEAEALGKKLGGILKQRIPSGILG